MTKKDKQRIDQKRRVRKSLKKNKRKKRTSYLKHTKKKTEKEVITKTETKNNISDLPLRVKIRIYIGVAVRKIKRLGCYINIHEWKICSGVEGQPMKTCIKCWKESEEKWGEGGSGKYYGEKYNDMEGVTDPKNWKEGDGGWYFKGTWIDLDRKMLKRLDEILGKPRKQEVKDNIRKEKRVEKEKKRLEKLEKRQ